MAKLIGAPRVLPECPECRGGGCKACDYTGYARK
jgi:hypothetical protein